MSKYAARPTGTNIIIQYPIEENVLPDEFKRTIDQKCLAAKVISTGPKVSSDIKKDDYIIVSNLMNGVAFMIKVPGSSPSFYIIDEDEVNAILYKPVNE